MIAFLKKVIGPLVLILPKICEAVKTFKAKHGDENKNNKLMSFHIDNAKLLEKYKTTLTKIADLKDIGFNVLAVYDGRHVKTKIRI